MEDKKYFGSKFKIIIFIILIIIIISLIIFVYKKPVNAKFEKIIGTEGIHSGMGKSGNENGFTFTISPSGNYLLFLKGQPTSSRDNDFALVFKDLKKGITQQIPMGYSVSYGDSSFLEIQTRFSKKCWTIDEKSCIDEDSPDNNSYTHAYVDFSPKLKYTGSKLKTSAQRVEAPAPVIEKNCSDCAPTDIEDSTLKAYISKFGEKSLIGLSYSIGKSGVIYSSPFPEKNSDNIQVFDPITGISNILFSFPNNKGCWSSLTISPNENKIAYINSKGCSLGLSMGYDLHIFDLVTKKDTNYGDKEEISLSSDLLWSPDSKALYFIGGRSNSVLYKLILP